MDRMRKNIIKIFKDVGFKTEIQTNVKIVDFFDVTFNLGNGTYRPYKKSNEPSLYINTSSNHPPQVIKQLPKSINKRLNKNSSCKKVLEESKLEYESALKNCRYNHVKLTFNKKEHQSLKRTRHRNIIWFNPPFSTNVTTNVAKTFLSLLDKHFPKSNNLHKRFNRNSVKVTYCCTENLSTIIKSHNKNVINGEISTDPKCNYSNKSD